MSSTDRHATEHALLDALGETGCAVCSLNRRALDGWMDSLLREGILDVKARLAFRSGGGFCPGHTRLLEERGSPLPVAILLHDLLTQAPPTAGKSAEPSCSACAFLAETEARYVGVLSRLLERPDARERYTTSEGLCIPHLRRVLRKARRGEAAWLREAAARHLASLEHELSEIIRKHDYRYAGEGWGDEADAWRRAAGRYAGECVAETGR